MILIISLLFLGKNCNILTITKQVFDTKFKDVLITQFDIKQFWVPEEYLLKLHSR